LVNEPWDAAVIPPANDPAYRRTVFGSGYGLLSFRVDEVARVISIFDILWIGRGCLRCGTRGRDAAFQAGSLTATPSLVSAQCRQLRGLVRVALSPVPHPDLDVLGAATPGG
jgi:hypothetical protein